MKSWDGERRATVPPIVKSFAVAQDVDFITRELHFHISTRGVSANFQPQRISRRSRITMQMVLFIVFSSIEI